MALWLQIQGEVKPQRVVAVSADLFCAPQVLRAECVVDGSTNYTMISVSHHTRTVMMCIHGHRQTVLEFDLRLLLLYTVRVYII